MVNDAASSSVQVGLLVVDDVDVAAAVSSSSCAEHCTRKCGSRKITIGMRSVQDTDLLSL